MLTDYDDLSCFEIQRILSNLPRLYLQVFDELIKGKSLSENDRLHFDYFADPVHGIRPELDSPQFACSFPISVHWVPNKQRS